MYLSNLPPFLGNVIIYGNSIDTYTTVETLLNLGVRGSCIHLVQHPPTSIITCINDCAVEGAIEDALQAEGVTVYRDALLAQWNNGMYPDPIHTASFTTPTKPFQLPCSVSRSPEPHSPPWESYSHSFPAAPSPAPANFQSFCCYIMSSPNRVT